MRDRLRNFMAGRYGVDQLNRFLIGLSLFIMLLSAVFGGLLLYLPAVALLVITYYRMLSRNYNKRYQENNRYLTLQNRFLHIFKKLGYDIKQRKTHHIYRCPSCRQKIRIPRGKGKVRITCPKCRTEFIKRS